MSQRLAKVNELLKREIVTCIERGFEFPDILVTIHAVDTDASLRTAKVFVGIIGEESKGKDAISKLNKRHGFIQNEVMKRVVLRNTPRLKFVTDDSVERGVRIVSILDDLGDIVLEDEPS